MNLKLLSLIPEVAPLSHQCQVNIGGRSVWLTGIIHGMKLNIDGHVEVQRPYMEGVRKLLKKQSNTTFQVYQRKGVMIVEYGFDNFISIQRKNHNTIYNSGCRWTYPMYDKYIHTRLRVTPSDPTCDEKCSFDKEEDVESNVIKLQAKIAQYAEEVLKDIFSEKPPEEVFSHPYFIPTLMSFEMLFDILKCQKPHPEIEIKTLTGLFHRYQLEKFSDLPYAMKVLDTIMDKLRFAYQEKGFPELKYTPFGEKSHARPKSILRWLKGNNSEFGFGSHLVTIDPVSESESNVARLQRMYSATDPHSA